jgi:hypothetical protein
VARQRRTHDDPERGDLTPFGYWLRGGAHGRLLRSTREHTVSLRDRMFVSSTFRALLGREPDEAGLRRYLAELASGRTTREQIVEHIGRSAEAAARVVEGPGLRDHVADWRRQRAAVGPGLRPVCFLHLMKSGGTALAAGLSELAEPWPRLIDIWIDQLVCVPLPLLSSAMLVTGHLPYGAMGLLPLETAAATVVREPVGRTLSHFAHVRTHGRQRELSLEEFVCSPSWRPVWVNHQTRQLAHDVPVVEAWTAGFTDSLQELLDAEPATPDAELLPVALERLDGMELVGVTEHLDALLARIAAFWGKSPPPPLGRANESLRPVRRADVPDGLVAEIERGTQADAALHARAAER